MTDTSRVLKSELDNKLVTESQMTTLVRKLKEIRVNKGITQAQVAAAVRTSVSAVAKFESGANSPLLKTVYRYAAAIGVVVGFSIWG